MESGRKFAKISTLILRAQADNYVTSKVTYSLSTLIKVLQGWPCNDSPAVFISIRALDDLWRENIGSVKRLPLSKFDFCVESFHLIKIKFASVQMCGVRRLEQWIYSIFSKHVSFFLDGRNVSPLSSRTKPSGLDVSTICSNTSRSSLPFDAPFITFT